ATVFATSMIYAQLKTVPRWNHATTPALFLAFSLIGGALLAGQMMLSAVFAVITVFLQGYVYASADDRFKSAGSNLATATGLGDRGAVRAFEPPHTGPNYLLKEMVHTIGRKHAQKLQMIVIFALTITLVTALLASSHLIGAVAVLTYFTAALAQRWLFFAEAEHVVGLYYGKR
ncbi:MAG: dibenzothiophene desulfurase, partial [Pseudomonadota bacterium]